MLCNFKLPTTIFLIFQYKILNPREYQVITDSEKTAHLISTKIYQISETDFI